MKDLKHFINEGFFDSSKKKVINWLNQNATKNTDGNVDYDYELEGGEQVKIANGGIMVDIESGISKKLSFSEFKKYFITESKLLYEGLFGKEDPQDVKAEIYKGYPKDLKVEYFTVDAKDEMGNQREYDEERYIADESEGWGKDKVFALASDDEYYIFKLGSKEHIENYNSKSSKHLTKVSERAFKKFLKKFKH